MASDNEKTTALLGSISMLGDAPDGQLATSLAEDCRKFVGYGRTEQECVNFLRDVRDMAVHTGGASSFTMKFISILVDQYPETEKEAEDRRSKLKERYGIK